MRQAGLERIKPNRPFVSVGLGTCGIGNGADLLFDALEAAVATRHSERGRASRRLFRLLRRRAARHGLQAGQAGAALHRGEGFPRGPHRRRAWPTTRPSRSSPRPRSPRSRRWDFRTSSVDFGSGFDFLPAWNELPFFKGQEKLVLRDCGPHRPREPRGVPRRGRLLGHDQGPRLDEAGIRHRGAEEIQAPRPRRRGLPHV